MNDTDFELDMQDDEARYEPAHVHRWMLACSRIDSDIWARCENCDKTLSFLEIEAVLNRHVQPVPDPAGLGLGRKL